MTQRSRAAAENSPTPEVVVIGGGPAGTAAAIELARRGRRVVLLERQESGLDAAEAIDRALARGDVSGRAFAGFDRDQRRRYRFFRRLVRGFYDPAFRDLFFHPTERFGLLDAIVWSLAGNWRPPLHIRLKLELFFAMVVAQRFLPLAPRSHSA